MEVKSDVQFPQGLLSPAGTEHLLSSEADDEAEYEASSHTCCGSLQNCLTFADAARAIPDVHSRTYGPASLQLLLLSSTACPGCLVQNTAERSCPGSLRKLLLRTIICMSDPSLHA